MPFLNINTIPDRMFTKQKTDYDSFAHGLFSPMWVGALRSRGCRVIRKAANSVKFESNFQITCIFREISVIFHVYDFRIIE